MKNKKKLIRNIVIGVVAFFLLQNAVMGWFGGIGPMGGLKKVRMSRIAGNAKQYRPEQAEIVEDSPLAGKRLCFLGSSVTKGEASLDVSFVEYIARRNQCSYIKEAVSGTTLADNGKESYVQRMLNNIALDEKFDLFICQLSTNDATRKHHGKMEYGTVSSSMDRNTFDTATTIGAMEYIISYAQDTWNCPVVFYTGTKYDSEEYGELVGELLKLQEKWGIGVIDFWDDEEMNAVSEDDYKLYMVDGIHPSQAGYLLWWTPKMESYLYDYIGQ